MSSTPRAGGSGSGLRMEAVREAFDASRDFTVGIEEEFAILDPDSLDLVQRFDELYAACGRDPVLAESAAGELITSEIEIRSGRGEDFADATRRQEEARERLFGLAGEMGIALGSMGTHPWASYLDQGIIDTQHYRRVAEGLQYVARRNNTFGIHVHVGIRGADRAVAVCDAVRDDLPLLLAVSAASPFLDGRDTGLHSVRSQTFTRSFPRCGVPDPFGSFQGYADWVEVLRRTGSIVEATQLWWSIRPHHSFGTVEVRICDAQPTGPESTALAALIASAIAQAALDHDEGRLGTPRPTREIEENLWRAIRHGMDGSFVDFDRLEEVPAREALDRLLGRTEPARRALGVEVDLPERTGAQRARDELERSGDLASLWADSVAETRATYAPRLAAGRVGWPA